MGCGDHHFTPSVTAESGGKPLNAHILSIRDPQAISEAVRLILAGELVIIPTDTIYGVAVLPQNDASIQRLYEVRQRAPEPALPLLLADVSHMKQLTRPNAMALKLARRFWPGALTLILSPADQAPAVLKKSPIAVRVPNYPALLSLLTEAGGYLLASGAILSGRPPAITAQEAAELFGDGVALILDGGRSIYGVPSTIVDCTASLPKIVRRGAVPEDRVWDVLGLPPQPSAP